MYQRNGIVYAEPYKLLKKGSLVCYQKRGDLEEFEEIDASLDDMKKVGSYIFWAGGYCLQSIKPGKDYGYYKERLIKRRYSNDDQIAIMLNRDNDEDGQLQYDKMQTWREWASDVAKKIMTLI